MLPAPNRLRDRADFTSAVRGPGSTRAGSRLVVVHANQTDARAGHPARVGFVVSKAVGGAVVRNRTKRRLRAVLAGGIETVPDGVDLVVRANPPAALASFGELTATVKPLVDKVIRRLERAS